MDNSTGADPLQTPEKHSGKKRARGSEDIDLTPQQVHFKRLDFSIETNGCIGQMFLIGVEAESDTKRKKGSQ